MALGKVVGVERLPSRGDKPVVIVSAANHNAAQSLLPEYVVLSSPLPAGLTDWSCADQLPAVMWCSPTEYRSIAAGHGRVLAQIASALRLVNGMGAAEMVTLGWTPAQALDYCRTKAVPWRAEDYGPRHDKRAFAFLTADAVMAATQPPDWLIRGWLTSDSIAFVFGEPGCGKTFLALDWFACIATGTPWHGCKVRKGVAVIVVGEGRQGLGRRIKAWSLHHAGALQGAPLLLSLQPARLTDGASASAVLDSLKAIADEYGSLDAIGVDTTARNYGPGDENSTQDAGRYIEHCDMFRQEFGACVANVHHSGQADSRRMRGNSAFHGATDFEYRVTKDGRSITVHPNKIKDFDEPEPKSLEMRAQELGEYDDAGQMLTSCVLHPMDAVASQETAGARQPRDGEKPMGRNQIIAIELLRRLIDDNRDRLENAGLDPAGARVSMDQWREASGLDRRRWQETKEALLDRGSIIVDGGFVTLKGG